MDITQKRRDQLRHLRDERFGKVTARLARALDRKPNYVSRVLRGEKGIAETFCRDIEKRLDLPHLWMDGLADGEQPADATAQLIDAVFLHNCMVAVDVFRERTKTVIPDEQRTHFACDLYSTYRGTKPTFECMVRFLANWLPAMEMKERGTRE